MKTNNVVTLRTSAISGVHWSSFIDFILEIEVPSRLWIPAHSMQTYIPMLIAAQSGPIHT